MIQINTIFQKVWFSRLISILGSDLTTFGISVWVYSTTGKATPMALILLCSVLPSVFLSPFSGVVCDKYNRKYVILLADTMAALSTILIFIYLKFFETNYLIVCLFTLLIAAANTFDNNAYQASISTLVKTEELKTANGLNQIIDSLSSIISPIVAGILYSLVGLTGIVVIDISSYIVSLFIFTGVNPVHFSNPQLVSSNKKRTNISIRQGLFFVFSQKSLFALLVYFTILNFLFNLSTSLIEPFTLTIGSSIELGVVKAFGGIGILCGSLCVTLYSLKKEAYKIIVICGAFAGVSLILMGSTSIVPLIAVGRLLFSCLTPVLNAIAGTLWMKKTPQNLQGRVFAVRLAIAKCFIPFSYLIVGPLVDTVLPDLLQKRNASIIVDLLGSSAIEYRIVFLMVGLCAILITAGFAVYKPFRELT